MCLEGTDQHRRWFQSQLLMSMGAASGDRNIMTMSPYGALITRMVLDEAGIVHDHYPRKKGQL